VTPAAADANAIRAIAEARRWYWMRVSSVVLAVCVLVHVVTIIYAVRGGLTAADILGRTRGSLLFGAFYAVFVMSCAVHVPLGLENVIEEWLGARRRVARVIAWVAAVAIMVLGLRAVYAVIA
jgi:fumarate reductase subunit C